MSAVDVTKVISGSSSTKKSSYLTNIVLGCASLICLSLYIFSGNSHNENIIPSCQPCVLTVCAPLVCIKKKISVAALGLALIGILHLIFVYNLFLTIVTLKKQHSLLTALCLEVMCFLDLIELYNLILTKVALKSIISCQP